MWIEIDGAIRNMDEMQFIHKRQDDPCVILFVCKNGMNFIRVYKNEDERNRQFARLMCALDVSGGF